MNVSTLHIRCFPTHVILRSHYMVFSATRARRNNVSLKETHTLWLSVTLSILHAMLSLPRCRVSPHRLHGTGCFPALQEDAEVYNMTPVKRAPGDPFSPIVSPTAMPKSPGPAPGTPSGIIWICSQIAWITALSATFRSVCFFRFV